MSGRSREVVRAIVVRAIVARAVVLRVVVLGTALTGAGILTLPAVGGLAGSAGVAGAATNGGRVVAVGAENEYANVIGQIGGKYVTVSAVMSNPNTDPHTFEASPTVARRSPGRGSSSKTDSVTTTTWTRSNRLAGAQRKVIDVQTLLDLPTSPRTRTFGTTRRRCRRSPRRSPPHCRRCNRPTRPTSRPGWPPSTRRSSRGPRRSPR